MRTGPLHHDRSITRVSHDGTTFTEVVVLVGDPEAVSLVAGLAARTPPRGPSPRAPPVPPAGPLGGLLGDVALDAPHGAREPPTNRL